MRLFLIRRRLGTGGNLSFFLGVMIMGTKIYMLHHYLLFGLEI
jgi:hypothetical protein